MTTLPIVKTLEDVRNLVGPQAIFRVPTGTIAHAQTNGEYIDRITVTEPADSDQTGILILKDTVHRLPNLQTTDDDLNAFENAIGAGFIYAGELSAWTPHDSLLENTAVSSIPMLFSADGTKAYLVGGVGDP